MLAGNFEKRHAPYGTLRLSVQIHIVNACRFHAAGVLHDTAGIGRAKIHRLCKEIVDIRKISATGGGRSFCMAAALRDTRQMQCVEAVRGDVTKAAFL